MWQASRAECFYSLSLSLFKTSDRDRKSSIGRNAWHLGIFISIGLQKNQRVPSTHQFLQELLKDLHKPNRLTISVWGP